MVTALDITAFDRGVRPVAQIVFPDKAQAVLGFRPDPEIQRRIEELAEKCTQGQLTEAERAEYKCYVRAKHCSRPPHELGRPASVTLRVSQFQGCHEQAEQ